MFIRLSRYVILGLIISLVGFLVTQNNKEKVQKETLLLIGLISAVIIFAISFRVEFYENTPEVGEKQEPLVKQRSPEKVQGSQSETTEKAVELNERERIRKMAIEMIQKLDAPGTEDDEELMKKVEEAIRSEMGLKPKMPKGEMAEKIVERVTNPKQEEELEVQKKPKENRLSMQYEGAIEDVIKEKIREQLYSDDVIKRQKESDYVIMPVSEWSLPLERRQFKCIPREEEEKEPCACGPGEGNGFWEGSFMKIRGAKELPPQHKNKVELI